MFDAKRFLADHNIKFYERGKNISAGWIGISCPLCGDKSSHGGFNIFKSYYKCWRCGYHYLPKVIAKLLNVSVSSAQKIFKRYLSVDSIQQHKFSRRKVNKIIFPSGTGPLTSKARKYLINRKFDPDKLIDIWEIYSTSHIGTYKNRILAPIYLNNKIVSYQTRDFTNLHPVPYLPCEQEEEILPYKNTLYGIDKCNDKTIIVEGITDVWRLGPGSICCFGIGFTKQQVILMARKFKTVFIFFDDEELAQLQADKLSQELTKHSIVTECIRTNCPGDPADLRQDDADVLIKELLG